MKFLSTKKLKKHYHNYYGSFFKFLEKAPKLVLPDDLKNISEDDIDIYYDIFMDYLKSRVSYCFKENNSNKTYTLCTWAKKASRVNILRMGTNQEKSYSRLLLREISQRKKPHNSINEEDDEDCYTIDDDEEE